MISFCLIARGVSRLGQPGQLDQSELNRLNWFSLVRVIGSIGHNPIETDQCLVRSSDLGVMNSISDPRRPHRYFEKKKSAAPSNSHLYPKSLTQPNNPHDLACTPPLILKFEEQLIHNPSRRQSTITHHTTSSSSTNHHHIGHDISSRFQ